MQKCGLVFPRVGYPILLLTITHPLHNERMTRCKVTGGTGPPFRNQFRFGAGQDLWQSPLKLQRDYRLRLMLRLMDLMVRFYLINKYWLAFTTHSIQLIFVSAVLSYKSARLQEIVGALAGPELLYCSSPSTWMRCNTGAR